MAINLKNLFGKNREEQPIDPEAIPSGSQPNGGKRLNGLPTAIIVCFALLALGTIGYVARDRSQNKIDPNAVQPDTVYTKERSASQMAADATANWLTGQIPSENTPAPSTPPFPEDAPKKPEKDSLKDALSSSDQVISDPYLEDRLRIRERRFQAMEAL